jgi:hypothetical protein
MQRIGMMPLVIIGLGLFFAVAPAFSQNAYTGKASGTLTVDGKSTLLRYAYMVEVDNVEEVGLLLAGPRQYQVIIFSDRQLPLASVANRNASFAERRSPAELFAPLHKTVVDTMRGIMLKVDMPTQQPFDAQLLYPGVDSTFRASGAKVPDHVTGLTREGNTLAGTALLPTVQPTHRQKGPKTYQYRISFRAPMLSEPPVKEQWQGKAALDSPPAQAIREYLDTAQKGDVATLRRLTAKPHLPYLNKPETLQFLKDADASTLAEQVKRVVVRGDTATVMAGNEAPDYSQVAMSLVRENGAWKLYWP